MRKSVMGAYDSAPEEQPGVLVAQMNRPDVQRVLLAALLEDPNVQTLLQDCNYVRGPGQVVPAQYTASAWALQCTAYRSTSLSVAQATCI